MANSKMFHKLAAILISLTAIFFLYSRVDFKKIAEVFKRGDYFMFFLILFTFVIMYLIEALRWKIIVDKRYSISYGKSFAMIACAGFFNVILPMKTSSFTKAYFMRDSECDNLSHGMSMVFYEKFSDLAAMSFFFILFMVMTRNYNYLTIISLLGAIFSFGLFVFLHSKMATKIRLGALEKIRPMKFFLDFLKDNFSGAKGQNTKFILVINALSGLLWLVYIFQTILFFSALRLNVAFLTTVTNMLTATYVGILPVSISGIGTRDLAIVYLFKGMLTYNQAISIGILSALRFCVPVLIGIPFMCTRLGSKK